jgi:hypothetical protein
VYAQHRLAEQRPWVQVSRKPDSPDTPLVYVARGSHASYFERGYHETEVWYDMADGRREAPALALEIVGDADPPWIVWPGRWGDTRPRHPPIDQPSPTGPGAHKHWNDPRVLLDASRPSARPPAAAAPEVTVTRKDGRLRLDYDFSKRAGPEPQKLIVTVNSSDEHTIPPRTFNFTVESTLRGSVDTRLTLSETQEYDVYVSTQDASGKPSESKLTMLYPAGSKGHGLPPGVHQTLKVAGHAVAWIRGIVERRGRNS